MRLTLLAVGDKLPAWAEAATAEYLKRMPREARVELATVKPQKRAGQAVEALRQAEATRLLDKQPPGSRLVALDEHGSPKAAPPLVIEGETAQRRLHEALRRCELRRQARSEERGG